VTPPNRTRACPDFEEPGPDSAVRRQAALHRDTAPYTGLYTGPQTDVQLAGLGHLQTIAGEQTTAAALGVRPKIQLPAYVTGQQPVLPREPRGLRALAARLPWQLSVVLIVQAGLSLRLIWSNTAFQDEALYIWAGRVEWSHWLRGTPVPDFPAYFSGAPVVYPPLAALAAVDGLAGARLLSLCFMLAATCCLYGVGCTLYGRVAGIGGAALFAVFGMGQVLGAFATYDAMALFLLAAASLLTVRASGPLSEPLLMAAAILIALADAAKYAAALWDPVIFTLAGLAATRGDTGRRIFRGLRLTGYVAALVALSLHAGGHQYVHGIFYTTVSRQLAADSSPQAVLLMSWGWLGGLVAVAAVGVFLSWSDGTRRFALAAVLLAAVALAPLEQARISTSTSLHKHVVFGAWFACVVGGYAIQRMARLDARPAWAAAMIALAAAIVVIPGQSQATFMYQTWPSYAKTMPVMTAAVSAQGCPCLMSAASVSQYYLELGATEVASPQQAALDGLHGTPAAVEGIARGYYAVVEVDANDLLEPADYAVIQAALTHSVYYRRVSSVPWSGHPATPSEVWERVPA